MESVRTEGQETETVNITILREVCYKGKPPTEEM